jgi:hypothetical protein
MRSSGGYSESWQEAWSSRRYPGAKAEEKVFKKHFKDILNGIATV